MLHKTHEFFFENLNNNLMEINKFKREHGTRLTYFFCILTFYSCFNFSQNDSENSKTTDVTIPELVGMSNEKLDILEKEMHKFVDSGRLAGIQTAILKNDSLVHFDSYGYSDIENKKNIDENSIFRIFSMTKPITSVGLMQLFEKGKFKLQDPLYLYIPEFKNMKVFTKENGLMDAKNHIKVIDLLRHTSGITYGRSRNENLNQLYAEAKINEATSLKEFVEKIASLPLHFEPGTDWEYSYATNICGYLIEILSGQPLDEYLQENVLCPLQMTNTHFQLPKRKLDHFTVGYSAASDGTLTIAELPSESRFLKEQAIINGGGGLVSTTNDYLNFCRMLLNKGSLFNNQILKPQTIDLMTKDHLASVRKYTSKSELSAGNNGFGLGFSIEKKNINDDYGVYGWGGAVGTYFRIDSKQDLAYIMMIQLSPYRQLRLRETFQTLVNNCVIDKTKNN